MLLTHRKLLQSKAIAIDNDQRATLRNFGSQVGLEGAVRFEARIRELVEDLPDLAELVEPLLISARRCATSASSSSPAGRVRNDEVCRRLMTVPGVGPVERSPIAPPSMCRCAFGSRSRSEPYLD